LITSLKSLNPTVGAKVVLEIQSPKKKIVLQLFGFIEGKTIIVSAPKKSNNYALSKLEEMELKVHIMFQGRICTFKSRVIKRESKPIAYWHLAYPKQFDVSNIRQNTRIDLQLPVSIEYQNSSLALKTEIPNIVLCTDISLQGLAIEAPIVLGDKGDEFFVTMRLSISDVDQLLLVPVRLRSVRQVEEGVVLHGFEFISLDGENKILLAAYIYKELLVNLGYVNE